MGVCVRHISISDDVSYCCIGVIIAANSEVVIIVVECNDIPHD